ncbi:hypothetical protein GCM10010532_011700 [Dactylosporangium siamense]|uniref:Transposase n=1 Tax=Dactylosporangium siamense TaxID=685454 RepID=A0A919PI89_9ACTN|nr:hypothetical protein Dsi01nite_010810 [Dactylosporangium siamense]
MSILLTPCQAGDNPQLLRLLDAISINQPGGRAPDFDKALYRQRNVVERCFNRFKQWRDLATRYAKRASIYRAVPPGALPSRITEGTRTVAASEID